MHEPRRGRRVERVEQVAGHVLLRYQPRDAEQAVRRLGQRVIEQLPRGRVAVRAREVQPVGAGAGPPPQEARGLAVEGLRLRGSFLCVPVEFQWPVYPYHM